MKCQYCGKEVPNGTQNCPSCGADVPQPPPFQSTNGFAQTQNGYAQQPNNWPQTQNGYAQQSNGAGVSTGQVFNQKSRLVYILLGLFLGCLGIHNFYAGYNTIGIVQLLITLFIGWLIIPWIAVGIWVLVEICTVDKDSNGIKFC